MLSNVRRHPVMIARSGLVHLSVRGLEGITINAENLHDVFQRLDGFCDGVEAKLNPDIAGPGVSAWQ